MRWSLIRDIPDIGCTSGKLKSEGNEEVIGDKKKVTNDLIFIKARYH